VRNGRDPKVTTPGSFTGSVFHVGADTNPKLVAAANSIAGLLGAVLGSLLNSLAQTAISATASGVNSALNGGVSSVSGSSITGGGTPAAPIALSCSPSIQFVSTTIAAILGALGGANSVSGNPPDYFWLAPNGATSTGPVFSISFALPGNYAVTLTDSMGDPTSTCRVIAQ